MLTQVLSPGLLCFVTKEIGRHQTDIGDTLALT